MTRTQKTNFESRLLYFKFTSFLLFPPTFGMLVQSGLDNARFLVLKQKPNCSTSSPEPSSPVFTLGINRPPEDPTVQRSVPIHRSTGAGMQGSLRPPRKTTTTTGSLWSATQIESRHSPANAERLRV